MFVLNERDTAMSIYIPYFYIIQDTRNNMYYVGSKYGKDANPETFWIQNGYTTSSSTINTIINEYGLSIFKIRKLKIFEAGGQAYDYETRFLQKIDAKNNPNFYNLHNNDKYPSFGSEEHKKIMIEKYGVEYPIKTTEIKEKMSNTIKKKYGVNWYTQTEEFKGKYVEKSLEKYGVTSPTKCEEIKEKTKNTNLKKYGNKCNLYSDIQKQKNLEEYGVEYFSQMDKTKEITKINNLEKYGVEHIFQLEEIKTKIKNTNIERYNETHYNKTSEGRKRCSENNKFKDGFFKGCKHTEESKRKISESSKNRTMSDETKEKIRLSNTGKKHTNKTKEKLREIQKTKTGEKNQFYGKTHTDETKLLMSEKAKNREKMCCEHCNMKIQKCVYVRYHGEKCKFKS